MKSRYIIYDIKYAHDYQSDIELLLEMSDKVELLKAFGYDESTINISMMLKEDEFFNLVREECIKNPQILDDLYDSVFTDTLDLPPNVDYQDRNAVNEFITFSTGFRPREFRTREVCNENPLFAKVKGEIFHGNKKSSLRH